MRLRNGRQRKQEAEDGIAGGNGSEGEGALEETDAGGI